MACDYLAIPATSCIAEHLFSLSGRTDDPQQGQLKKAKFGGLQKIWAGYLDGWLNVEKDIMENILEILILMPKNTWISYMFCCFVLA